MSTASTSRTIKFISKAGTYTATILSPQGDLWQEYEGTTDEPGAVRPAYATLKPTLLFVCTSSRVAEGVALPDSMEYYFNGVQILFGADGISTGTFAGAFRRVEPTGEQPYHGLQLLADVATLAGYAPATLRMVAAISYGTQSDRIQASYTIPVQQATGSSYRVTIAAADNKNFVIRENGGSCTLSAKAWMGATELLQGLTYQWEKMGPSGWQTLTGQTAKNLTVHADDVDTWGEVRVHVFRSGAELGADTQGVMDASDPYDIDPHPSPEDEAITEDPGGNSTVTYTPVVVRRGTGTQALTTQFLFVLKDAAGVYLNTDRTTPQSSYTVTRAHCLQAGGDVSVTITSAV